MQQKTNRGNRDLISDLSGGVNQFNDPSKIGENEFMVYDNLISLNQGRHGNATKRKGFESYNTAETNSNVEIQSIFHYKNPGTAKSVDRLIVKSASTLEYLSGSSFTDIATGMGSGKVDFEVANTNLYIAGVLNGSNEKVTNKYYDGTNYLDMGCVPCNNAGISLGLEGAGSTIGAGTYYYIVTFLYGNQESGVLSGTSAGNLLVIVLGSGQTGITLSNIPTGSARVSARKIYRSLSNTSAEGPTEFYYVGVINDNTTTTFTDRVPENELATPITRESFFELKRPYISKYHSLHSERLVQGNVVEKQYEAIPSADITLAQTTGGGLSLGTYTYRFYKIWIDKNKFGSAFKDYNISLALEKTVVVSGLNNAVNITYSGSDDWFEFIIWTRTSAGGTVFNFASSGGFARKSVYAPYKDIVADASLVPVSLNISLNSRTEYSNLIAWSEVGKPDLYPSANTLEVGETSQEITGIFSEENRMVIFKERGIFEIKTEVKDSRYWSVRKIVEHIGAPNKNSIVHLPSGGFVFYSGTNIYLWDGRNQPVRISDPVYQEVQAITSVHCGYDKVRNWLWAVYNTASATGRALIYDLNNGKWYPFTEDGVPLTVVQLKLGSPYQLTDGTMIFGGTNAGRLMKYGTNNQDNLNSTGTTFANSQIRVKIQTRMYDTWRTVKEFIAKVWASGNGTMDIYFGVGGAEGTPTSAPITGAVTRIRKATNTNAKEFYLRMENAENIALSIKQIGHLYSPIHTESDGY